jgi:outer membrane protein OmpA-like peptidoglycan-associated protein
MSSGDDNMRGKLMNPVSKILLGALGTAALAWFLHGPMKFGEKCAAGMPAATPAVEAPLPAATAPEAPATVEQVANCQTKVDGVIAGKTINFQTSGAAIAADSMPLIDAIATELKNCAGTTIEVAGHTDSRGSDTANQALSEARAAAVVKALSDKGVPAARLTSKGYGESKPLDPALTQDAYAKNRRTEFSVQAAGAAPAAAGQ